MNVLLAIRAVGLLVASGIGIFRLVKNHLTGHERFIYLLSTVTTAYMGVVYLMIVVTGNDYFNLIKLAWLFLLVVLISLMTFYRGYPRNQ